MLEFAKDPSYALYSWNTLVILWPNNAKSPTLYANISIST